MDFNQKLIFVTGKGGVGKSFISSIIAHNISSSSSKKVLIIESETIGAIASQFEHTDVGYDPVEIFSNIYLCQINTQDSLSEYLKLYAKIPTWAKFGPLSKLIDIVAHGAPGVKEILVVGKICFELKKIIESKSEYDCIIVDSPATGHVISLLEAPWSMKNFVSTGMVNNQTKWMCDLLENKDLTGVLVVANGDEVVLNETKELIEKIEIETHSHTIGVVLNKYTGNDSNISGKNGVNNLPDILKLQRQYLAEENIKCNRALKNLRVKKFYSFPLINNLSNSLRNVIKYSSKLVHLEIESENSSK